MKTQIEYAHQVQPDTGTNKPFNLRSVECSIRYIAPDFPGDVDGYILRVNGGQYDGLEVSGDSLDDCLFAAQYVLMDKSRAAFNKS